MLTVLGFVVLAQVRKTPMWADSPEGRRYAAFDRGLASGDFAAAGRLLDGGLDVDRVVTHGETRLMIACYEGKPEVARFLVRRGAGLERTTWRGGLTPLAFAANSGHAAIVDLLLKAGAKPDGAKGGYTPLQGAAGYGYVAIVRTLLRAGARVDATDDRGMTPLMQAAWDGEAAAVRLLLAAGAKPGLKDRDGQTALDMARQTRHREVERLLREALGASAR